MYVVTGATGHVGNTLVKKLISEGKEVRALTHDPLHNKPLETTEIEKVSGDILHYDTLVTAFTGADVVIHSAALISISPGMYNTLYDVNVKGTENVIKACRECNVKRLIYISSIEAIGDVCPGQPVSEEDGFNPSKAMIEYGETKAIASMKVIEAIKDGLDAVIVSPVGVIGPNDFKPSQMGQMVVDFMHRKLPSYPASGVFDFVDVRDVVDIIIRAIEQGKTGENYLVTGGHLTVAQIMDMLQDITGIKKPRFATPLSVLNVAAVFAELFYKVSKKTPVITRGSMNILKSDLRVNGSKAQTELGYNPTDLRQSFKDQISWFKSQGKV